MRELSWGKSFAGLVILTLVSVIAYSVLAHQNSKTYYDFLLWNLFLAWIPYILSSAALLLYNRLYRFPVILLTLLAAVWILFLPNAPYIITDLIHLTILKDNYSAEGWYTFFYWFDFLIILLIAWNGLLLGFVSMYHWHFILRERLGSLLSWFFVAAVSLLSAYGILLGREYRLNSWDVLADPEKLRLSLLDSLEAQALAFCGLFGLLIFAVYAMMYLFLHSTERPRSIW
ncbi:DUF1361 domain-containing protein [Paenibacillus puerhi]|uniref:DUF1361 domain-containing protein n=1 Tax=Paenibacillus puerhi TaxID=2692622 RepID=UPI00135C5FE0|nr:DUF1361 domain-containing protein [Paenibacillus puerhi]